MQSMRSMPLTVVDMARSHASLERMPPMRDEGGTAGAGKPTERLLPTVAPGSSPGPAGSLCDTSPRETRGEERGRDSEAKDLAANPL